MSKLQTIELKEIGIVEIEGEYHKVENSIGTFPLYFNNRSLQIGRTNGILEKGLEQELFAMIDQLEPEVVQLMFKGGEIEPEKLITLATSLTLEKMKDIIWLAYVGARTGSYFELEDFKSMFEPSYEDAIQIYINILTDNLKTSDTNNYAKKLGNSIAPPNKSGKK